MNEIQCPCFVAAQHSPEQLAIVDGHERLSFSELDQLIHSVVLQLREHRLSPGEPILIYGPTSKWMVALFFACLREKIVFAPLSLRIPERQIYTFARQIQATKLIYTEQPPYTLESSEIDACSIRKIDFASKPERTEPPLWDLEQWATILQTSGSTGQPKAAVHSLRNHYYSALGSNQNIVLTKDASWLLSLPLYHVAGIAILMRCSLAGAAILIQNQDVHSTLETALCQLKPTHLSFVPTQLTRLLTRNPSVLQALQKADAILLGGSSIPSGLLKKSLTYGLSVHTSYGSTEMASQIATTPPHASLEQLHTAGQVLPYRAVKRAEDGEICVRGETLFLGYLHASKLERPMQGEWFPTGDRGEWDVDGSLRITGRKDAMFISGGENIQPEEIEQALEQHADVEWSIVVDIPHDEFGARPCAFVKMKPDRLLLSRHLKTHLQSRIAKYKIPDRFYHWPQEECGEGIKISRSALRTIARRS